MVGRLGRIVARPQTLVGDEGDAHDGEARVGRRDDLRRGGHADGVSAQDAHGADFRGRLEGGPRQPCVHARVQLVGDALLCSHGVQLGCQGAGEDVVQGGEAGAVPGVVLAHQGVVARQTRQVQLVCDAHEVAHVEGRVHATGSICDDDDADPQRGKDANLSCNGGQWVALVRMQASTEEDLPREGKVGFRACAGDSAAQRFVGRFAHARAHAPRLCLRCPR